MKAKLPIKTMLRCLPVPEALRTERWILQSALSLAFFSRSDNIAIHLWPFTSVAPENATNYMYVCWVSSPQGRFTTACGVNDQGPCVEGIVNHLRFILAIPEKSEFTYAEQLRIPWIRFAMEIDPASLAATYTAGPTKPDYKARTIEDMLAFVTALGEGLDEPLSRATGALSAPTAPDEEKVNHTRRCLQIGILCKEQEMEVVYWPTFLLQEALEDVDLFVDTIIPPHYIPVGPELWYPEQRIKLEFPDDDPRREWELSGFEISAIILLPSHADDRNGCMTLFLFQTDMLSSEIRSPDDMVPRIMIAGEGKAGEPCCKFYHWIMAGIEFLTQAFPGRSPHTYSSHEHKMAQKHNRKLQPYSIMEVRKVEHEPTTPNAESPGHSPYKHSFFQRRHRRRLNKPRKSDGLQVIRVAAGQKCKHLPLMPGANLKITKVVR